MNKTIEKHISNKGYEILKSAIKNKKIVCVPYKESKKFEIYCNRYGKLEFNSTNRRCSNDYEFVIYTI